MLQEMKEKGGLPVTTHTQCYLMCVCAFVLSVWI